MNGGYKSAKTRMGEIIIKLKEKEREKGDG